MDAYLIAKFLHIIGAICWAGGGATMMVMTYLAKRKGGGELLAAIGVQADVGDRWFVPASLLTLITGIAMTALAGMWSQAWIVLGLVGYFITAATGPLLLKRHINTALQQMADGQIGPAEASGRRYLNATSFDYSVMLVVIALMVSKPSALDLPLLASVIVVVVVAAAAAFLLPAIRKEHA